MKTKKIISIALTVLLMFSFCSFSSYAADGSGEFSIDDCVVISSIIFDDNSVENVSSLMIKEDITSGTFKGLRRFSFPSDVDSETRKQVRIRLVEDFSIRADHEYNLKFKWGYNYGMNYTFKVYLRFNDAYGKTIKSQSIYETSYTNNPKPVNTVNSIDLNFTPVIPEDETGYKCDLYMEFVQTEYSLSSNLQSFYISKTISLTDLDDNSGLINSIIDAIKAIPEKIKGFFTDLASSIGSFFQELADNIKGFFDSLKNYILYFQDPVTLNEDGVLVDENGQPIYVNPFENSIEDIEETFNGWIEDIRNFISDMDSSRVEVSGYLQTGTGLINDILGASPIISAVLVFIASFFVIRKVVGR